NHQVLYAVFLEAKPLITLDFHPNVITCFRIDIIDNSRIFMEYANTGSLRDLINSQKLKIKDIIDLNIQICSGMSHAHNHNKGWIHRNLKPENILLSLIDIK
ncbi:MAG: protein kinase domain-containing protein, partial [Nitrososphaeraceae archaeon]